MDSTNNQTAAQAAGAPEPDAPATEQPTKSAAETKLEGQLADAKGKADGYKKERDAARGELKKASQERDELRTENGQLKADNERLTQELADAKTPATTSEATTETAAQEPSKELSKEDEIRDVLKRNGLKKCWMLENGPCFSEAHAKEYAGAAFESLIVISIEEDAPTR